MGFKKIFFIVSFLVKKTIPTPIGILIIVLVALLAGGILGWQCWLVSKYEVPIIKISPKEKPEKKIEIETADWRTYRSEDYGFELKYPTDSTVREEVNPANVLFLWIFPKEREGSCLLIVVNPNPMKLGLIEDLRRYEGTKYEDPYGIAVADCLEERAIPFTIGGKEALKCETVRKPFVSNIILVSTNGYIYHIKNLCEKEKNMETIYNLMLSTFRFLE